MASPRIVTSENMKTTEIKAYKGITNSNNKRIVSSSSKIITAKSLKTNDNKSTEKTEKKYSDLLKILRGTGKLWEDPDFPANSSSLFYSSRSQLYGQFQWMRPKEITPNAQLFNDSINQFDVVQGELGDCWLLAPIAALSLNKPLFRNVVPSDQDFDKNYIGAFKFRFWNFGKWKEIIVDDRIPTKYKKLIYLKSSQPNIYWSALLEKAYAKMCGNYEALSGGSQSEAMEDFTGGLCERVKLKVNKLQVDLYKHMLMYISHSSLLGCDILSDMNLKGIREGTLKNGLITGHAYSITGVQRVKQITGNVVELVRIRNPWGNEKEWNGRWSDNAVEWKTLSENDRKKLCEKFKNDGEFWISFEDFVENFTKLDICHLGPDSLDSEINGKKTWEMSLIEGSWSKNVSAGGCRNFINSFAINPQYRVQITKPDEGDKEKKGIVIIGLMQKDMRKKRLRYFQIGYIIYKISDPKCGVLGKSFFQYTKSTVNSQFIDEREVYGKHKLPIGHYVIIPSTYNPNEEAEFIMRIFTQKQNKIKALDMKNDVYDIFKYLDFTDNSKNDKEKELEESFKKACWPNKGISASELRHILNETIGKDMKGFSGFHLEICRSIFCLECIKDGKLKYPQFIILMKRLQLWKLAFKEYEENNNGFVHSYNFRSALRISGFTVCNSIFHIISNRYSDPENGVITFEDFILAAIRLSNAFETTKLQTKNNEERLLFTNDEFMLNILNF